MNILVLEGRITNVPGTETGKHGYGARKTKAFYDRSTFGPQYEVGGLVMVFNPILKHGQTNTLSSFTVDHK